MTEPNTAAETRRVGPAEPNATPVTVVGQNTPTPTPTPTFAPLPYPGIAQDFTDQDWYVWAGAEPWPAAASPAAPPCQDTFPPFARSLLNGEMVSDARGFALYLDEEADPTHAELLLDRDDPGRITPNPGHFDLNFHAQHSAAGYALPREAARLFLNSLPHDLNAETALRLGFVRT